MALVRHPEVQRVRPQRRVTEWGRDGTVVQEGLFFHHEELIVATDPQVWCPDTDDAVIRDVGEAFNDEPRSGHFLGPGFHVSLGPVLLTRVVGDGVRRDLMAAPMDLLDGGIIGIFMRDEEG